MINSSLRRDLLVSMGVSASTFRSVLTDNHIDVDQIAYNSMGQLHADTVVESIAAAQTDPTSRPTLQIVLTYGQSLTVGSTRTPAILSTTPRNPEKVLALDFSIPDTLARGPMLTAVDESRFRGFAPLREGRSETHVSAMMDALVDGYVQNDLDVPTFVHINSGAGGRSIFQLMTSSDDIYATLAEGIAATQLDDVFAVPAADARYDFYIRSADGAVFARNAAGPLVLFDNLESQLRLAVSHGIASGFDISPTVVLNWSQGQSDNTPLYGKLLTQLFDKVEAVIDEVVSPAATLIGIVSQTSGYGTKLISTEQLAFINAQPNVAHGANEFMYQALYPAQIGSDYTHLNPEGYFMMGQRMGRNMFDMLQGNENLPMLIDQIVQTSARTVIVTFANVDGHLVDDPSIFAASNLLRPPRHMGFGVYSATGGKFTAFSVSGASITGTNAVELTFSADLTGAFRIYAGRSDGDPLITPGGGLAGFGGTTLREAESIAASQPSNGQALVNPYLHEYVPSQFQLFTANTAPQFATPPIVQLLEGPAAGIDINVTDDRSTEGAGISYAIVGGVDSALFTIDVVTGRLQFAGGADFERPRDADANNSYRLLVSARDTIGATTNLDLQIIVQNANEAPTALTSTGLAMGRDALAGTTVGWLQALDPDTGDRLSFGLPGNAQGAFAVDQSGRVTVADPARLGTSGQDSFTIVARVTDSGGLGLERSFDVAVLDQAPDSFNGTNGADVAQSLSAANWTANGYDGDDRLTGDGGNDIIRGGNGDDWLSGRGGRDELAGGDGNDTASYADAPAAVQVDLTSGRGTGSDADGDRLSSIENLVGSAFNDVLTGDGFDNLLSGGLGDDMLFGGGGSDTADYASAGAAVIVSLALTTAQSTGGGGRDTLREIENVTGSRFNDTLTGNGLNNLLSGGAGNDRLSGDAGRDVLNGGDGDDILSGGLDDDQLFGGAGVDRLDGGSGSDVMTGGAGDDTYTVDNIADIVDETDGRGGDAGGRDLVASTVSYALTGPAAFVEGLSLKGSAAINGTGNALGNVLTGNSAANTLIGLAGNDSLEGGEGNDILIGGRGADSLGGGTGADRFVFDVIETSANRDRIRDFEAGIDRLVFDRAAFLPDGGTPGADAFTYGTQATSASHRFVYDQPAGLLYFDPDGVGGIAQTLIVQLQNRPLIGFHDMLVM